MMTAKRTARVLLGMLVLAGVAICQTKAVRVHEPARRLALVIGNAAYANNPLANPEGDARLIEATLDELGFDEVVRETNLGTLSALRGAVRALGRQLSANDLAFFYYSGHGLQAPGGDRGETQNYLLPTGYDWETPLDEVEDSALSFEQVKRILGGAQLRVMVLDACRKYKLGKSDGGGGLAPTVAARGELIAYATEPDAVATDKGDGAGIYAQELSGALQQRGVEVKEVFQNVMERVDARTKGAQHPEYLPKITGRLYLNGRPTPSAELGDGERLPRPDVVAVVPMPALTAAERWPQIERTEDEASLERFLERYGGTDGAAFWTGLAEQRLESVREARATEREEAKREAKRREAAAAWAHVQSTGTPAAARLFVDNYRAVAPDLAREATAMLERLKDAEKKARVAGQGWRSPLGMEFAWIPAGRFEMGSPSHEEGRDNNERQHGVRISEGFWMGRYEVTQWEWESVMGNNPSTFESCGRCPVEEVSWNDVQVFIRKLNERESGSGNKYRLPTEAEWEYAARAGTVGARHGELGSIAWYDGNSGGRTHPVGEKQANAWGLHDMLGNVWEWTGDWYGDYPSGMVTDPRGPSSGSRRVNRGGGWHNVARLVRSADRGNDSPGFRIYDVGFRLVRTE